MISKKCAEILLKKRNRKYHINEMGVSGSYLRISRKIGIKIVGHINDAEKEFKNLYDGYKRSKLVPKPLFFGKLKINFYPDIKPNKDGLSVCIFMEHIIGRHPDWDDCNNDKLYNDLESLGIIHEDLHNENIIIEKGIYRPIDFRWIKFKKEKLKQDKRIIY